MNEVSNQPLRRSTRPLDSGSLGGSRCSFALMTVVREIPNLAAIRAFGSPSAASLRISAQSSKVITLQ